MPYTKPDNRTRTVSQLAEISDLIRQLPEDQWDGELNFAVSFLVARAMQPATGWRYHWLHRAYGVFALAGTEFYRRLVAPYEDQAIVRNGDLEVYRDGRAE